MKNVSISLILLLVVTLPLMASPKQGGDVEKAVCTSDTCSTSGQEVGPEPAKINTPAVKSLLKSKVPLFIFDARSGKYDDGKRIPGAKFLSSEAKPEEVAKSIPSKEALVITYCANLHCPASHKLYEHLQKLGYKNLLEYPEGIEGWIKAGQPVEKAQ